ncbi:MAG: hypothetical protein WC415_03170 [Patescibacteria group bacterium]|jgi:hypothetical protein
MKKVLLSVSRCISGFLIAILAPAFFLLYIMFTLPAVLWIGGGMTGSSFTDNFGGLLVKFFQDGYVIFFFFPFLPFLAAFFVLSVFVWIYYRRDKEVGRVGFKNIILCILTAFFLIILPIKASQLSYSIQEQRDKEVAQLYRNDDGTVYINKGFNKEFFKLYQTLADEGIQSWRKDPIAVVKNELEKGDLTYLSHGENELTLKIIDTYPGKYPRAIVALKNERLEAEIWLSQYWESADGVWLVKSYKRLTKN